MARDPSELYDLASDVPVLEDVVLVQALDGFVDAGGAKRLAREHLMTAHGSRVLATFDVDALLDYRGRRPDVRGTPTCNHNRLPFGAPGLDLSGFWFRPTRLAAWAETRIATVAAFGRAGQDGIQLLGSGPGADPGTELRSRGRLVIADLAERGRLTVVVARTFPLDQAAEAVEAASAGPAEAGQPAGAD